MGTIAIDGCRCKQQSQSKGTDDNRNRRKPERFAYPTDRTAGRGQTEPLAALVSVAAVCLALSMYTGVLSDVFAESGNERQVADTAMQALWADINQDGVFDSTAPAISTVRPDALPQGRHVSVSITTVSEDGSLTTVDRAVFEPDGTTGGPKPEPKAEIPETANSVSRPVPVVVGAAEVKPGRLTVEVWQ